MTTVLPSIVESFDAMDGNTAFTMTIGGGLWRSGGVLYSREDRLTAPEDRLVQISIG